ncbi:outer membrane beta-barrel protein [Hymenobacter actinosclerus]|uniref:Outer membrane protein beta-barrel domain-containing protein n=1 Tax=Hymenobacter actinosclerus TaxID=82805 RepID=A0A1I0C232_9BACT|nr:outer membrane beta-barrel protein [Hymenobacter actinosclerus]SET13346.1 Outer membrane protein beta-barrel domain-containing protein [Hymenobacter actinosclerus]
MLIRTAGICAAALLMPLLGSAQSSEPAGSRYYIGLAAYTNWYQRLSREQDGSRWPPLALTLGYQLRPRWAVQLSAAYSSSPGSYAGVARNPDGSPIGNYRNHYRNSALSMTALGRYTITRTLSNRLQLDALGGFSVDRQAYQAKGYNPDYLTPAQTTPFDLSSHNYNYALSVGPSLRYRISSGLEAVGEGTVNMDLRAPRMITTSASLGLRYRFGRL